MIDYKVFLVAVVIVAVLDVVELIAVIRLLHVVSYLHGRVDMLEGLQRSEVRDQPSEHA